MTLRKSVILFVVLIIGLLLFRYLDKVTSEQPNEVSLTAEAEYHIKSEDLLDSFISNEELANKMYVEKTIEVEGIVKEVTFLNNRYTVLLQGNGSYTCIMCDMKEDQVAQVQTLAKGNSVVLKGICKGFLMDAILLNCVLVKKTNE
ncbi:OB-fold protein [Flagellimonas sp.]|uniref:OB-fold protein n=1 Tax=Flagellimonas sp. TaxID=2058762 RepID=UPI003F4A154A